jgi:hypothetical protein
MVNFIRQNLLADTESGDRLLANNGAICWKTLSVNFATGHCAPYFIHFHRLKGKCLIAKLLVRKVFCSK